MESSGEKQAGPKRIGELLVAANVIRTEILLEALQVSKISKSPIGRTLMSMGRLTEADLQAAIEVQDMLRAGLIATEFGVRALNVAVKNHVSLSEAFTKLGWQPPLAPALPTSELGELLLEGDILSNQAIVKAMHQSKAGAIPLGRCLVMNKALSEELLASALTAQVLLRDGKIKRQQAIAGLKVSAAKEQPLEKALEDFGAYVVDPGEVKLGQILVAAGLITESEKASAIEIGLLQQKPIGAVLVEALVIPPVVIEDCLKLQKLVAKGAFSLDEIVLVLKESQSRHLRVEKIIDELDSRQLDIKRADEIIDFLLSTKLLSVDHIKAAQQSCEKANVSPGEVLLDSGMISRPVLDSVMQAKKLIEENSTDAEHALAALEYSLRTGIEFHRAFMEIPQESVRAITKSKTDSNSDDRSSWLGDLWLKVIGK